MVPEGWELSVMGDHVNLLTGFAFKSKEYTSSDKGISLLRGDNIAQGYLRWRNVKRYSHTKVEGLKKYYLKEGDFVIAMDRTWIPAGVKVSEVTKDDLPCLLVQRVSRLRADDSLNQSLLKQYFSSHYFEQYVKKVQTETAVPHISPTDIREFPFLVPPLLEQKKIAKILSTWDMAITTTEQLITSSQKQKKALMRELLTGKKRLIDEVTKNHSQREGFSKKKLGKLPNDWKVEVISKYFWYQEGPGVRKHQFTEDGVKLFNGTNIQNGRIDLSKTLTRISDEEARGSYSHFLADSGDLVIACSGISVDRFDEKIAFLSKNHLPLCMNTSTMRFKCLDGKKASLEYFRYFMMSPLFKNQIRRQITGSAQLNFGPSHVGKCFVVLPSIEEQHKITKVLKCADQGIETLQQKLNFLIQEKEALMQQLLTGKRRVKLDD